jgi:hypothetical protein
MGRLFDSKDTSKSTTKGRLFTEPVAEQPSTLGKVGEFVKPIAQDIYKTAATIPVRAAQAEELLRTQAFGSEESKKKAMEFASQPVNIGMGTQVKPLDTSSTKRAAQQTVGDIVKTVSLTPVGKGLTLAKEAALMGGAYGLGNGMSEGKSIKDTAIETALGAAGGLVVGKGLSILGGAKVASQLAKKTEEQLYEEALARANLGAIPEASNPRLSLPSPRTPSETPIQLPSEGILKGQQLLRETGPTVVTPQESVAIAKAKKEGVPYVKPTEQPVIPVKVPEITTIPDAPITSPVAPEGFQSMSYTERTAKLNQMDAQHIEDVVFNGASPEAGLPKEAYISHLYNQAETNPALAERLATSGVVTEAESKAGQNLGALAQAQGSVVSIIKDAHEALKKALPGYVTSGEKKALETIQSDIKTAFSKFNNTALSVEERLSAIDILKCK